MKRRARSAQALFERPASREDVTRVLRYVPNPPLNYLTLGFDPTDGDERILAQILDFSKKHTDVRVLLLTIDGEMRRTAKDHGLAVVEQTDELRGAERPDALEKKLQDTQERLDALLTAAPNLSLTFTDSEAALEIAVFPEFEQMVVDDVILELARPEPRELAMGLIPSLYREVSSYDDRLSRYAEKLRVIARDIWSSLGSYGEMALMLHNVGDLEADDVPVRLQMPSSIALSTVGVPKTEIPPKPARYELRTTPFGMIAQNAYRPFGASLSTVIRGEPKARAGPAVDGSTVEYWFRSSRQRSLEVLAPVTIQRLRPVPAVHIEYQIRARNMAGIRSGKVLVRFNVVDLEDAREEFEATLKYRRI